MLIRKPSTQSLIYLQDSISIALLSFKKEKQKKFGCSCKHNAFITLYKTILM